MSENISSLVFQVNETQKLVIPSHVLKSMRRHQQIKAKAPEAGGMLFAKMEPELIRIELATEPQTEDKRSRFFFWPSLKNQQRTIDKKFCEGLHFIGEWHTHPELTPTPSELDLSSMSECLLKSKHELNGLVMAIVGTGKLPGALWISIHTSQGYKRLNPSGESFW